MGLLVSGLLGLGLALALLLGVRALLRSEVYRNRRRVVELIDKLPGPKAYPLVGNMHQFKRDPWDALQQGLITAQIHGPIFRIWASSLIPVVVLTEPEAVREVLKGAQPKSFTYKIIHPWLGLSLLTSSGETWKRKRKLITPAFHFQVLRGFISTFVDCTKLLIAKLETQVRTIHDKTDPTPRFSRREVEMSQPLTFLTLDIISRCAFGYVLDPNSDDYVDSTTEASKEMLYHLYWIFVPDSLWRLTPSDVRFRRHIKVLQRKADELIRRRQQELIEQERDPSRPAQRHHDFLQMLLDSTDEVTGERIPDQELRDEVNTFLFEGHDTTATSLLWTLYLISTRPDVAQKIRDELAAVLGDRDPTYDDLGKLRYLSMVIKEALRLYPSVPLVGRHLEEDMNIMGYEIPANTQVLISLWMLHHNPNVWPDPSAFIPERFETEECKKHHPYAWVPFSAGPRNCVGQNFAMLEEKVVLAMLLRRFRFELVEGHPIRPDPNLILRAKHGVKLRVFLIEEQRLAPSFTISSPSLQERTKDRKSVV